jgi:hypothetical protein
VPGKLLSSSEILCTAPQTLKPGPVDLSVSLLPGLYSSPVTYLYYMTPVVLKVDPPSGPEYGFTQLVVQGRNFLDLGEDSAQCVFNKTRHTNATVVSDTVIICDSPSILNKQGYSELPEGATPMYWVDVTLDGGLQTSESSETFRYYTEPTVTSISPALGPLRAGTTVTVNGTGFAQAAACKRVVRLGHLQVEPTSFTNDTMTFQAPVAPLPATTVVAISLNGQQFTGQHAVHSPAHSATFDYYKDPYASVHYPSRGPTNGGTQIITQGYGFMLRRPHLRDHLWARFVDPADKRTELAPPTEVQFDELQTDKFYWLTPAVRNPGDALLQISLNKQNWHEVKSPALDHSFTYYSSPHISSVNPPFGHVKATIQQTIELKGTGFECFDSDCSELKCRFGNSPDQYIFVQGELVSSESVRCKVP